MRIMMLSSLQKWWRSVIGCWQRKSNTRRKRENLSNTRKARAKRPCDARMQSWRPCGDRWSRRKKRTRVWKWTEMIYWRNKCVWSRCVWSRCARRSPHSSNSRNRSRIWRSRTLVWKFAQKVELQIETVVSVELHEALEQNYQLQNQLEEQIVNSQEQEKLNAELHFKLLEEKEKLIVREQENSMLELRMEKLSDEVERTHILQSECGLTCVSEASKDKNAPQRFAGEDNSQNLTETQQEFKMDFPTDHEITDVTENAGNMWKSLQAYGNTEFHDAFIATQEVYQKIRSSGDTSGGEVVKLEHPKNKRQSKFEKESLEFNAEVADVWSATMTDMDITSTTCDDVDENFDIDDENWDHYWNTVDLVADEILAAIVLERDKECDVTASEQTRKKTTWLMLGPGYASSAGGSVQTYLLVAWVVPRRELWRSLTTARLATTSVAETVDIASLVWSEEMCRISSPPPSCKIRLGTNCETSRVSTGKFTVARHKNRSCKYMEDMYCDNDYINMTPTRYSVLITSESGDELISLREQFIERAEQHLLQHVPRAKFGWWAVLWNLWKVVYGLDSVDGRVWTAHTTITSREWQQYSLLSVSGWWVTKLLSCVCVLTRDQGNEFLSF